MVAHRRDRPPDSSVASVGAQGWAKVTSPARTSARSSRTSTCAPGSAHWCAGTNVFPSNTFGALRCVASAVANAGLGGTSTVNDADPVAPGRVNFYQVGHHTAQSGHASPLGIVPASGLIPPANVGQLVSSLTGTCP